MVMWSAADGETNRDGACFVAQKQSAIKDRWKEPKTWRGRGSSLLVQQVVMLSNYLQCLFTSVLVSLSSVQWCFTVMMLRMYLYDVWNKIHQKYGFRTTTVPKNINRGPRGRKRDTYWCAFVISCLCQRGVGQGWVKRQQAQWNQGEYKMLVGFYPIILW